MKIGFLVNDVATEYPRYATTLLANTARKRGHDVVYLTVEDFTYRADGKLWVRARSPKKRKGLRTYREYLAALQEEPRIEVFEVGELDVLMLRNDPAADLAERPWAQNVGVAFGREAVRAGVIVLNDPDGLALASNKFYFQLFPERVRPRTLITRDPQEIKRFAEDNGGRVVNLGTPQGVARFVQPGSDTNVYVTYKGLPGVTNPADAVVTKLVLSNIKVLANQLKLPTEEEAAAAAAAGQTSPTAEILLTVAVTPDQAEKLIFAKENGSIWLGLVNPGDAPVVSNGRTFRTALI